MENLNIPQRSLEDWFTLLDYQKDFMTLKQALDLLQDKLSKISLSVENPDGTNNIIDDSNSANTTTYSSLKIMAIFDELKDSVSQVVGDGKQQIVDAINAKKPVGASIADTWEQLAFYIGLLGNINLGLKLAFSKTTIDIFKLVPNCIKAGVNPKVDNMVNPNLYKPNILNLKAAPDILKPLSGEVVNVNDNLALNISVYLNTTRVY